MEVQDRRKKDILSRLFYAEHLGQLKSCVSTRQVRAACEVLSDVLRPIREVTLASLLDVAFECLAREFPVEYVFKSCALEGLLFGKYGPATTAFYAEFPIGDSRADVVLVNGSAHVYEIKTRYDDLCRLDSQLHDYYRAFTHVTLFVDAEHTAIAVERAPEYTGIVVLGNKCSMSTLRPATEYRDSLDHLHLFRMLRRHEYSSILRARGVDPDAVDPASRYRYCLNAFSQLPIDEAYSHTVLALKHRQRTERFAEIASTLPRSLRLAPFAHRMTLEDWKTLSAQMCRGVSPNE